jgi:putative inorganic carbon (HCO3(-)) transporter
LSVAGVQKKVRRADAAAAVIVAVAAVAVCLLLALALGAGAGNCGAWYAIPPFCRSVTLGLPAALVVAALPLFVMAIAGRALPALLVIYIVLVPIDDALQFGAGPTITKLLGLVVALAAVSTIVRRRERIEIPYAALGWLALVAFMVLSLLWSIDPSESIGNLVTITSLCALLLVLVAVPMNASELRTVVVATILSAAAIGIIALVSAHRELSTAPGQVGRLYLSFGTAVLDPNRFGAALILPIAVTAGAIGQAKGWTRVVLFIPLILGFTAVYLSASRGALLGLAAAGAVAVLASRRRLLFGSLLAAGSILLFVVPSELSRRLNEVTLTSGTGRTDIWKVALAAFPSHWLLGSGQGTFIASYNRAFFLTYQPQFVEWNRDPHNLLMSTAVELGLVGVALLLVVLVLQYRSTRLIPPDNPFSWLSPVFRAALVGLVVSAMFVDVLATKFAWLLFMEVLLFAGFGARWSLPAHRVETRTSKH